MKSDKRRALDGVEDSLNQNHKEYSVAASKLRTEAINRESKQNHSLRGSVHETPYGVDGERRTSGVRLARSDLPGRCVLNLRHQ
jgi:hypothetical protein